MQMKRGIVLIALAGTFLMVQVGAAQAPANVPAGATGICKDGTYYNGASKKGACSHHGGLKDWYGTSAGDPKATTSNGATPKPAPATGATPPAQAAPATSSTGSTNPAPGGGADKVWLNTSSNVYHCPGTRYYGTTKSGAYMTEAEAKEKGARPDHGKPCK